MDSERPNYSDLSFPSEGSMKIAARFLSPLDTRVPYSGNRF